MKLSVTIFCVYILHQAYALAAVKKIEQVNGAKSCNLDTLKNCAIGKLEKLKNCGDKCFDKQLGNPAAAKQCRNKNNNNKNNNNNIEESLQIIHKCLQKKIENPNAGASQQGNGHQAPINFLKPDLQGLLAKIPRGDMQLHLAGISSQFPGMKILGKLQGEEHNEDRKAFRSCMETCMNETGSGNAGGGNAPGRRRRQIGLSKFQQLSFLKVGSQLNGGFDHSDHHFECLEKSNCDPSVIMDAAFECNGLKEKMLSNLEEVKHKFNELCECVKTDTKNANLDCEKKLKSLAPPEIAEFLGGGQYPPSVRTGVARPGGFQPLSQLENLRNHNLGINNPKIAPWEGAKPPAVAIFGSYRPQQSQNNNAPGR